MRRGRSCLGLRVAWGGGFGPFGAGAAGDVEEDLLQRVAAIAPEEIGGGAAILDAREIGRAMLDHGVTAAALQAYEAKMRPITLATLTVSWWATGSRSMRLVMTLWMVVPPPPPHSLGQRICA